MAKAALGLLPFPKMGDPNISSSGSMSYQFTSPQDDQVYDKSNAGGSFPVMVSVKIMNVSNETFKVRVYKITGDTLTYNNMESALAKNGINFTATLQFNNPDIATYVILVYKMAGGNTTPVVPCQISVVE